MVRVFHIFSCLGIPLHSVLDRAARKAHFCLPRLFGVGALLTAMLAPASAYGAVEVEGTHTYSLGCSGRIKFHPETLSTPAEGEIIGEATINFQRLGGGSEGESETKNAPVRMHWGAESYYFDTDLVAFTINAANVNSGMVKLVCEIEFEYQDTCATISGRKMTPAVAPEEADGEATPYPELYYKFITPLLFEEYIGWNKDYFYGFYMELPDVDNLSRNVDARCQREYDCWNSGARWEYATETCIVDDADGIPHETSPDNSTIFGDMPFYPDPGSQNGFSASNESLPAEIGDSLNYESAATDYDPAQFSYPNEPAVCFDSSAYYSVDTVYYTENTYPPVLDYNSVESGGYSVSSGFAPLQEAALQGAIPGLAEYYGQITAAETAFVGFYFQMETP